MKTNTDIKSVWKSQYTQRDFHFINWQSERTNEMNAHQANMHGERESKEQNNAQWEIKKHVNKRQTERVNE